MLLMSCIGLFTSFLWINVEFGVFWSTLLVLDFKFAYSSVPAAVA